MKKIILTLSLLISITFGASSCGGGSSISGGLDEINDIQDIERIIDESVEELENIISDKDKNSDDNAISQNEESSVPYYKDLELPTGKLNKEKENEIITHTGYTTCYNTTLLIPMWVAYELTDEEVVGQEERSGSFVPDPDVKAWCATTNDYKHSGYDRGHMAPAADMKWNEQAMHESFYLSNICPQNHNLNAGDWKELEEQVRDWAIKNEKVYVVCGPIMKDNYETIGENRVAVPDSFYKVVLMYKDGKWRALGFIFANKAGNKPLDTYAKSVDEIEKITKLNFFSALPDEIENEIEKNSSMEDFEN